MDQDGKWVLNPDLGLCSCGDLPAVRNRLVAGIDFAVGRIAHAIFLPIWDRCCSHPIRGFFR